MKRIQKVLSTTLIVMLILTFAYAQAFVQWNMPPHDSRFESLSVVGYAAFEYTEEESPPVWYWPKQLGIIGVAEVGADAKTLIADIDLAKEPFPLQANQPIFRYKGKFYMFSSLWVTFEISNYPWLEPLLIEGLSLCGIWTIIGILFVAEREKRVEKVAKIVLVSALSLTLIYSGVIYTVAKTERIYASGALYSATLSIAESNEWHYPEDLGIIQIIEENATHLSVSISEALNPGDLETEHPILKYEDKFYQIQSRELYWDALFRQHKVQTTLIRLGFIVLIAGWLFTVALAAETFLQRRRENKKIIG